MGCCLSRTRSDEFVALAEAQIALKALEPCVVFTSGQSGEIMAHRLSLADPPSLVKGQTISKLKGSTAVEWIAVNPNGKRLYAFSCFWKPMSKVKAADTQQGSLGVFDIQENTGQLNQHMLISSLGHQPCAATFTKDFSMLGVAHYLDGRVTLFPLSASGDPDLQKSRVLSLPWKGEVIPDEDRVMDGLTGPLCHGIAFSPSGKWVVACDAGQSRLVSFGIVPENSGKVVVADVTSPSTFAGCLQRKIAERVGARPRHLSFHPDGTKVYALFECTNYVTVHHFDEASGSISQCVQELPTMEPGTCNFPLCLLGGVSAAAEIEMSSDGKLLLVSNRGICSESSIASFTVLEDGKLTLLGQVPALGSGPRHFTQHENLLLVGLEQSKSVAVFDVASGKLVPVAALELDGVACGPQCIQVWKPA